MKASKAMKLMWAAGDIDGIVTGGKVYTITGKFKVVITPEKSEFFYMFKNDRGDDDSAASRLFVSQKRKR